MESEAKELFDSAKKASDAATAHDGAEEDRCIDTLIALKKFLVNYQILVSTQMLMCLCFVYVKYKWRRKGEDDKWDKEIERKEKRAS
nr:transcription elongation factor TFIIS [Tanacetum cinerariifolium]